MMGGLDYEGSEAFNPDASSTWLSTEPLVNVSTECAFVNFQ